jgi:hypothetical protein
VVDNFVRGNETLRLAGDVVSTDHRCVYRLLKDILLRQSEDTDLIFQVWQLCIRHCCHSSGTVGRYSSVSIATRYGLDGPLIELRWGRDYPHTSRLALGSTQPPIQWVPGLSRE